MNQLDEENPTWGINGPEVGEGELCPECGGVPDQRVDLAGDTLTYNCGECGETYHIGKGETCLDCGKPLGSTNIRCYTCSSEGGEA